MKQYLVLLLLPVNVFGAELALDKVSGLIQSDIKVSSARLNVSCSRNNLFNTVDQKTVSGKITAKADGQAISFPAVAVRTSEAEKLISCAVTLSLHLENNSIVSTVVAGSLSGMHKDVINTLLNNKASVTQSVNSRISKATLKKNPRTISGYSLDLVSKSLRCETPNLNSEVVYVVSLDDSNVEYQTLTVEEFIDGRAVENFTELVKRVSTMPHTINYRSDKYFLELQKSSQEAELYIENIDVSSLNCNLVE